MTTDDTFPLILEVEPGVEAYVRDMRLIESTPPPNWEPITWWERPWIPSGDMVHIVTDHNGKVIDRYTVRVDHDSGDEQA